MKRRDFIKATAATAVLAACQNDPGTGVQLSPSTKITGPSRLVLAQPIEPNNLDPQFEHSGTSGTFLNPMLEHLTEFDRKLVIRNVLAESAAMPTDGLTYKFKLRPNVKFWDGVAFDASAVKFTYDRSLDPEMRKKGLIGPVPVLQNVDHVRVVDPLNVEVVTKKPSSLAWPFFVQEFILAPQHYGTKTPAETALAPMGTGPWKFVRWDKGDRLEMTANAGYWRGKPQVESLIFRTVPDAATRLALLERGEADIITDLAPDDLAAIKGNSRLRTESALTTFRVHVGLPCNHPRWKDRRARLALNYAINVDNIVKFVLGGLPGERVRTPVITPGWENPDLKTYPFDQAKAKDLLNAAGFDFDKPVNFYTVAAGMKRVDVAQAIAADLQRIGMKVQVQVLQTPVFTAKQRARDFDGPYLHMFGAPSFGPVEVALPTGDLGLDGTDFINSTVNGPIYKQKFDEVRATFDDAKQHRLVNELQALFMEESAWILLYREVFLFGVNKRTDWRPTEYTRLHFWLPGEDDARIIA